MSERFVTTAVLLLGLATALFAAPALAQNNPVPFINQPLVPDTAAPGSASFTLTVNGTDYVSDSVVNWNSNPLATTFISRSQLSATVPAADIAKAGTGSVTVTNPAPGGGNSNAILFPVSTVPSSLVFNLSSLSQGFGVIQAASADFNGDGKADFVGIPGGIIGAAIYLGNGDGTFQAPVFYPVTGENYQNVTVADFDGDGNLDFAVTACSSTGFPCPSTGTVSVLLGNGDGTFRPELLSNVGVSPSWLATGDFNADGKLDLAVENYCGADPACVSKATLSILLGKGDGTFQTQLQSGTGGYIPGGLTAGDYDGDGALDLGLTECNSFIVCGSEVAVLLGNGNGTFRAPSLYSINGTQIGDLVTADINGDSILDLLVAATGANDIAVLTGKGNGSFAPAVYYQTSPAPVNLLVGDFNNDGIPDVGALAGSVSLLLGSGGGKFKPYTSYASGADTNAFIAADFNGDGRLDFLSTFASFNSNDINVLLQSFGPQVVLTPSSLTFSAQPLGTASLAQSLVLSNIGNETLSITNVSLNSNFGKSGACQPSIAPGASCTIKIDFAPKHIGPITGTLSITDNASGSPQTVALSGTGTAAEVSPASLNFGRVAVGQTSAPQTVTLTNVASSPFSILAIRLGGSDPSVFAETNTCPQSLAGGASCTVTVTFTPHTVFNYTATLDVFDNAGASPQAVSLSGTGTH